MGRRSRQPRGRPKPAISRVDADAACPRRLIAAGRPESGFRRRDCRATRPDIRATAPDPARSGPARRGCLPTARMSAPPRPSAARSNTAAHRRPCPPARSRSAISTRFSAASCRSRSSPRPFSALKPSRPASTPMSRLGGHQFRAARRRLHLHARLHVADEDARLSPLHLSQGPHQPSCRRTGAGLVPPEGLRFHIRQAVELGYAQRIGHGVDVMYEDDAPALLKEMAAKARNGGNQPQLERRHSRCEGRGAPASRSIGTLTSPSRCPRTMKALAASTSPANTFVPRSTTT